ncbi:MAG: threonine synthase [Alphaproteobacteria bacterium]|nr:threonine synthase [Alphaproteobacteria bacterium]
MKYISTRGHTNTDGARSFEDVLLTGLAPDGGLYVPEKFPFFDKDELEDLRGKSYIEVASAVMWPFVEGSIEREDFDKIVSETYAREVFDHESVTPLVQLDSKLWLMELHRGPTIAFKDVALQMLGRLFDHVLKKRGERVTIVGATSGDTGSAAIEGCKSCDNVDVFILHPKGRVSDVQRKQMTTINAANVYNLAVEGTFDDCQNAVKDMFNDPTFRADMSLSAINSINWARIMAQIVYYFTTALALGAPERKVSFSVPTGNFGNVFAAHCARKMGLPIDRLLISTNKNDILTRFFETGDMKMDGVDATLSPSMDIQISSNFERYLFELFDRDAATLTAAMEEFKTTGSMSVGDNLLEIAKGDFSAHRCDDEGTLNIIREVYHDTGEILDPHTAVGVSAAKDYQDEIEGPIVALACAHAAKFPDAVEKAIGIRPPLPAKMSDLFDREEFVTELPNDLATIQSFVRKNARSTKKDAA